jgi:hypothetical protein
MDLTDECAVKIRFSLFSRPERWTMATGSCFGNNDAWVFFTVKTFMVARFIKLI